MAAQEPGLIRDQELVAHGFEQIELEQPRAAMIKAGALTRIISPEYGVVRGRTLTSHPGIRTELVGSP